MEVIKNLCRGCVNCITSCFKTEEEHYREKMMELDKKIQQPLNHDDDLFKHKKFPISKFKQNQITGSTDFENNKPDPRSNNNHDQHYNPPKLFQGFSPEIEESQKFFSPIQHRSKLSSSLDLTKKILDFTIHQAGNQNSNAGNRNSDRSEDSFMTMQSASVGSSNSISRRTFKSVSIKSSGLRGRRKMSKGSGEQFKSIDNRRDSLMPYLLASDSNVEKYSQAMSDWNQKEYEMLEQPNRGKNQMNKKGKMIPLKSLELSPAEILKLNSHSWLDEFVNKLEDFYMFYMPEEIINESKTKQEVQKNDCNSQSHILQDKKGEVSDVNRKTNSSKRYNYQMDKGYYLNQGINYKCYYHCESGSSYDGEEEMMSSQKGNKNYMKLITFFCNTSNPLHFLHWYNSVQVRARLYDFNNIKMAENGIYPTFVVEQYSGLLPNKNKYQMVRQIELVRFDNEPEKEYIMQLDCTYGAGVGEENRSFRSLLRFEISQNGLVEIYSESCEKTEKGTQGDFFGQQWNNFEQKLIRDHILKPLWKPSTSSKLK